MSERWLRRIDGRLAVELEIDSGFSHLVYLTSKPLDRLPEPSDGAHDQADHFLVRDRSPGIHRVALERLIDELRDLFLQRPHLEEEPNRLRSERQSAFGGEPACELRVPTDAEGE